MTEERLVLADLLEKAGEGDFLRAVAEAVLQLLMESDSRGVSAVVLGSETVKVLTHSKIPVLVYR